MSRFVDRLIAAEGIPADGHLETIRQLCVNSQGRNSEHEGFLTHYFLRLAASEICMGMPDNAIEAAPGLFKPLNRNYSFEVEGWLTYFVLTSGVEKRIYVCGERAGKFYDLAVIESDEQGRLWPHGSASWNPMVPTTAVQRPNEKSAVAWVMMMFCMHSMLVTVPGLIETKTVVASEKLQKARTRSRKKPLVEYVNLDIFRPKAAVGSNAPGENKVERIRHQVIGHYRLLTANRPAPALSFVRSHWRGTTDLGIRIRDYTISDSGLPFQPPSISEAA